MVHDIRFLFCDDDDGDDVYDRIRELFVVQGFLCLQLFSGSIIT